MRDTSKIKYGSSEWRLYQYERAKEENRGHNYQYWTDKLEADLEKKGYTWYVFKDGRKYYSSELAAKEIVEELRNSGHYARIIAGMCQDVQRTKYFSITYKKK